MTDTHLLVITGPVVNSYTKFVGSPEILHDHAPDCHPSFMGMDAWMTPQLNIALIRKLRGTLMCLAYFLTCYPWVFVQPGIDRRPVNWCSKLMPVLSHFSL